MSNDSQTVPRTVWKGQLTLGLLALPVRFVTAARNVSIELNQLHRSDHSRLKQVWFCAAENVQVAKEDVVKGYEYEDGKYVIVDAEEIKAAGPESARIMEVMQFVFAADVDPVYFDTSYYLEPGEGGEKPYALLYAVMQRAACWALTRIAMHNREHVAILRPGPRGIVLQTLYYQDEIRSVAEFRTDLETVKAGELDLAEQLVQSLLGPFKPEQYRDSYRENMMALIHAKVTGGEVQMEHKSSKPQVLDIMEALRLSVAGTGTTRGE
jgi:DNA end-binding protein Ku